MQLHTRWNPTGTYIPMKTSLQPEKVIMQSTEIYNIT
jgi:hypothetical protein